MNATERKCKRFTVIIIIITITIIIIIIIIIILGFILYLDVQ